MEIFIFIFLLLLEISIFRANIGDDNFWNYLFEIEKYLGKEEEVQFIIEIILTWGILKLLHLIANWKKRNLNNRSFPANTRRFRGNI